jgi:flagellar hook-associated protein 1 FlgK
MSILTSLSIAARAMQAQQQAMQTTSHNIANVATPGYSRQNALMSAAAPALEGQLLLGNGVTVTGVRNVVDRFAEMELLTRNAASGYADARSRALGALQDAFPVSGGIQSALDGFFNAWSALANNPGGQAERVAVVNAANALTYQFSQTRSLLVDAQTNLDGDLNAAVGNVNSLLTQIADFNGQIAAAEAGGQPANDLRDQRQLLLQQVSGLTGATVLGADTAQATVLVGGLALVSGDRAATLDANTVGVSGFRVVNYTSPNGGLTFDASSMFSQGEIGGILGLRDTDIPGMLGRLDQLAKTIVDQVNTQHAAGFDLNGAPGGNFFTPVGAVAGAAGAMQVAAAVSANPNLIAAAQTAAGAPGDNRNALAIAGLQTGVFAALGNKSPEDYYLALVQDVGSQAESASDQSDFQQSLLTQAQARRDSLSGVSLEEEMTKLILFQRAFEASSVLVRTGDEMYQTIINMVQ